MPSSTRSGLEIYAPLLNDLIFRPDARPHYEMMSGALLWDDEKAAIPFIAIGWFRATLAYRTSVLLAKPRIEFESIWTDVQRLAPRWPGFRPERCTPSADLVAFLTAHKEKSERDFRRILDATSGKWRPLSGSSDTA